MREQEYFPNTDPQVDISQEIDQQAIEQEMIKKLSRGFNIDEAINEVKDIIKKFNISEEIVQQAVKQGTIYCLSDGNIYRTMEIKRKFNVSEETINSSEVQKAAKQGMISCLSGGKIYAAKEIKRKFNVSEETTQEAVKQGIINRLSKGNIDKAKEIKQEFNVSKEIISSPEVQKAAKQGIIKYLSYNNISDAKEIKQEFNVSKEIISSPEVQKAAKQGMISCLSGGKIYAAKKIKEEFNVSEEATQEAVKQGMINCLSRGNIDTVKEIKQEFNVSKEIISSPEVQKAVKQGMIECLSKGNIDTVKEIKQEFNVSKEIISSPEVQKAVKQGMIECLSKGNIDTVKEIKQEFNVSKEIISSPEVQKAVKQGMIECLSKGNIDTVKEIKQEFNVSKEIISSPEVQKAAKQGMIECLSKGNIDTVKEIKQEFNVSEEATQEAAKQGIINSLFWGEIDDAKKIKQEFNVPEETINLPEVQKAAKQGMIYCLSGGKIYAAKEIKQEFNVSKEIISSPEVQKAVKQGMIECLSKGNIDTVKEIKQEFNVSKEIISSPEVQYAAKQGMKYCLSNRNVGGAKKIKQEFNVSEEATQEVAKQGIINSLFLGEIDDAKKIKQEFNVSKEIINSSEVQKVAKKRMIYCLSNRNVGGAKKIKQEFNTILSKQDLDYCIENKKFKSIDNGKNFFDEDCQYIYEEAEEFNLLVSEFCLVQYEHKLESKDENIESEKQDIVDQLKQMDIESRSKYIFDKLKGNHENWTDEQNIITPFESGSEIFGHSKMFKYIFREDITKHDALHDFLRIIDLYNASGLSSNEFFNNILQQVKDDTSNYESGTSYHLLNNIARNVNINFEETIDKAKQYDLPTLTKLLESINSSQDIFSSWKMLKKYNELCSILNKSEVLEQLKGLKETGGSIDLHNYIETLAFHPNIAMAKVIQFWKNPEEFLDIGDSHTPDDVHNRKKPSNYVDIPNLDLSAKELRDALVEGYYDHLQVFEPLEINYKILVDGGKYGNLELNELILKAIGKRRENIKGEAKNPNQLFSELQKIFKENQIDIMSYLKNGTVEKNQKDILDNIKEQIINLIYNKNIGLKDDRKFEEYLAKINLKSDPDGVVAGNDTACCMPFGSGKNNVYTFNPICSLFTVQRITSKGEEKIIGQSVITKDKDIEKNIAEVIEKLNQSDVHMHNIVDDRVLLDKKSIITCDNIEIAPNFRSQKDSTEILKYIYTDYFKEYIKRFAKTHNLDENKVIVGLGYTDANISAKKIENTFVPEAPVGYSDNLHNEAMLLDLNEDQISNMIASKDIRIKEKKIAKKEQEQIKLPKGVTELTFQDSIPVAYIEGKAYKDNQKLIEYLHNMENALIAKDVNNNLKGRANMSFKYAGEDKKMHGYILSYEGKMNKDKEDSESIVYVADLASDGNLRAGGSLILAFAEAYKKHYIDKNNIIPILAQFREKTSYQIITKQLEKLTKDTGIEFETEELDSYKVGDDTMHEVLIKKKE